METTEETKTTRKPRKEKAELPPKKERRYEHSSKTAKAKPVLRIRQPTEAEIEAVEQYMRAGLLYSQIARRALKQFGLAGDEARRVHDAILLEWQDNVRLTPAENRAMAINRIRYDLAYLRTPRPVRNPHSGEVITERVLDQFGQPIVQNGKDVRRPIVGEPDYTKIERHERLLAQIEGTLKPIEVQVDQQLGMREAFKAVIESYSPAEFEQKVREQELSLLEAHKPPSSGKIQKP